MSGRAVTGQFGSWGHRTVLEVDALVIRARRLIAIGVPISKAADRVGLDRDALYRILVGDALASIRAAAEKEQA